MPGANVVTFDISLNLKKKRRGRFCRVELVQYKCALRQAQDKLARDDERELQKPTTKY